MKEETKKISHKKKLYNDMPHQFEEDFILPELEDRKEKLQKIRQFHQPIRKEEIIEHSLKTEQQAKERIAARKQQRDLQYKEFLLKNARTIE